MTVCNMAIEAGARAGLVACDETTIAYVKGRPVHAERPRMGQARCATGARCIPMPGAHWDAVVEVDASTLVPQVTWGTSPEMVVGDRRTACPTPSARRTPASATRWSARCSYMALEPNQPIEDIRIDKVFIGSCTNARIEDLREAAAVVRRVGGAGRRRTSAWRWSCRARAW